MQRGEQGLAGHSTEWKISITQGGYEEKKFLNEEFHNKYRV